MTYISSSDNQNAQEMSKYNCDGMFLDIPGPSEATSEMKSILVRYAYDLFIVKESNLSKALDGFQPRLLQHVGESIFTQCDSEDSVIQEVTMASNDAPHPTESCEIEAEFSAETDCYPMKGRAKVYYTPSEQTDQTDEDLIVEAMSKAVKSAMDNSVLVTDTVLAAYFIGERQSEGSPGHPDSARVDSNIGWVSGTVVALLAVVMFGICFKCRKKKKKASASTSTSADC